MDEEERRKDETFVLFSASHLLGDLQLLGHLSYEAGKSLCILFSNNRAGLVRTAEQ